MEHIGYYNPSKAPIAFIDGQQQVEMDAGQPVLDSAGNLINPNDIKPERKKLIEMLDGYVRSGVLSYIPANDPRFKNWDKTVSQQKTADSIRVKHRTANQALNQAKKAEEIRAAARASHEEEVPDGTLMDTTEDGMTIYEYNGKRFHSLTGLKTYVESLKIGGGE